VSLVRIEEDCAHIDEWELQITAGRGLTNLSDRVHNLTGGPCIACLEVFVPSHRDLLEQPAFAVQIVQRGVRRVALSLRSWLAGSASGARMGEHAAGVVERLADLGATTEQFVARDVDARDQMTEHSEPPA
jgi:hypothetical protein